MKEATDIINSAKNIYLIPSQEPGAIASTLALFYTLNELKKNVNLIIENIPENLKFLIPSLDFVSYPKNFVISVPNKIAKISQIFYEKNDESLKIHLTVENGNIKKEDVSFYYSETKPDLIITVGVKDYSQELSGKLNSFGFLLDSPVLNIDNSADNKKFGKINLIESVSLAQTALSLAKELGTDTGKKEFSSCILSGIVIYTENFKTNLSADIFETTAKLMKSGADLKEITKNLKT